LEWLEVRLDIGCDKRLVYEYRIERLKCDRDTLKQECRHTRIACSGTQPPTHLSEKIQRARSYHLRVKLYFNLAHSLYAVRSVMAH